MSREAEQIVSGYLFNNYGDFILADNPIYDVDKKIYVSNLRSDYPIIFEDDRTLESRFHLLKVPHVGSICVDNDFKIMKEKTTPRDTVVETLRAYYNMWLVKAEEIVVAATAEGLVTVSKFTHFFDIIDAILGSLYDEGSLTSTEIEDERHSKRLKKTYLYMQLLEGLSIVRRDGDMFKPGNMYSILKDACPNKSREEFLDLLMCHIIRERYSALRDVFKLTILEPTIRVDSSVFLPEIEEGGAVYRTEESIQRNFRQYYERPIGILDLRLHLRRLENAKVIQRDGKLFFGNGELRTRMIEAKKREQPIMNLLNNP